MTAWIIEDEPPALRRLTKLLTQARPGLIVAFSTDTIASCVRALQELPAPDVIFSDIHLADGLAFDIWEQHPPPAPLVFTTAYDQYSLRAFRVNGVDYLLKPIEAEDLERSLARVEARAPRLAPDWRQLADAIQTRAPNYRERLLARKGSDFVPVRVSDLRQFYSQDGLTFALTADGTRALVDHPLDRLHEELDPARWFRINRAQIVAIESVRKASPHFNHRLVVTLSPAGELENLVARGRVRDFKVWLGA